MCDRLVFIPHLPAGESRAWAAPPERGPLQVPRGTVPPSPCPAASVNSQAQPAGGSCTGLVSQGGNPDSVGCWVLAGVQESLVGGVSAAHSLPVLQIAHDAVRKLPGGATPVWTWGGALAPGAVQPGPEPALSTCAHGPASRVSCPICSQLSLQVQGDIRARLGGEPLVQGPPAALVAVGVNGVKGLEGRLFSSWAV